MQNNNNKADWNILSLNNINYYTDSSTNAFELTLVEICLSEDIFYCEDSIGLL